MMIRPENDVKDKCQNKCCVGNVDVFNVFLKVSERNFLKCEIIIYLEF